MGTDIKRWHTQSYKDRVCFYLIIRRVAFNYIPEQGIVFEATKPFVDKMANTLVTAYGCSLKPIINELK